MIRLRFESELRAPAVPDEVRISGNAPLSFAMPVRLLPVPPYRFAGLFRCAAAATAAADE